MKRQHAAGKPFFLYLPFSMGHFPNLPAKAFAGKSRIGNYGDKMMEGDYHVGQILDALKDLGIENDTIVIFASDNGPQGMVVRELGNDGTPDSGFSGPFRGELGDASEGSIRTFAFVRWPGHVQPNTTSYAMFSEMDFLPTLASILGAKLPTDRVIDGVDQSDVLFGKSTMGHRESLLTFIGPDLVAARWKQWRIYFRDIHTTGEGTQRLHGFEAASSPMNGYPNGLQYRDGPWRAAERRGDVRVGPGAGVEGDRSLRTVGQGASRSACAEHDTLPGRRLMAERKEVMRSLSLYFLTDVIVLAMAIAARAGEGGSSHYAPGSFASFVDVLPGEPSLAAFNYFTYYNGSAGVSRELEIAGLIAANVSAITAAARMAQEMYPKNHGRSDWSSEAPARSISTT